MNTGQGAIADAIVIEELFGLWPVGEDASPSLCPGNDAFVIWTFAPDPARHDEVVTPIAA
jgi:hypothetical protein